MSPHPTDVFMPLWSAVQTVLPLMFAVMVLSVLLAIMREFYRGPVQEEELCEEQVEPSQVTSSPTKGKKKAKKKANAACPGCRFNLVGAIGKSATCPYCRATVAIEGSGPREI